jgi:hypothetical protein
MFLFLGLVSLRDTQGPPLLEVAWAINRKAPSNSGMEQDKGYGLGTDYGVLNTVLGRDFCDVASSRSWFTHGMVKLMPKSAKLEFRRLCTFTELGGFFPAQTRPATA